MSHDLDGTWIARLKWDGVPRYQHRVVHLGDDEHGVWFGYRAGSDIYRANTFLTTGRYASVICAQPGRRWLAWFLEEASPTRIYCDVTTPLLVDAASGVETIDLDLDVVASSDGRVVLVDEDEFAEHRVLYGYPDEECVAAEETAARLVEMVTAAVPPFDGAARPWLERLASVSEP